MVFLHAIAFLGNIYTTTSLEDEGGEAALAILRFAMKFAPHCVSLARPSLAVCETGRHATVKNTVNQRAGGVSNKIEQLT